MDKQKKFCWVAIIFLCQCALGTTPPTPVFENSLNESSESGYIKLSWEWEQPTDSGDAFEFELQQADNKQFENPKTIYTGPDYATFLSGLKNGSYYHRIRANAGENGSSEWSETLELNVKHHSLQLALTLFAIGAIVFLLTVGIIVKGNRSTLENQ